MSRKVILSLAFILTVSAWGGAAVASKSESQIEVVQASEIKWSPLNPLRGDKGPQAGTLWGDQDRKDPVATGFLVRFKDGFSSPPHIHNTTYRGVVISGLVHNDDPKAEKMWMPTGSFWTQPAGEVHITAAMGSSNVAYIEIDKGPYLVLPSKEAFDRGERPVNVDASNVVWIGLPGAQPGANGPKLAYLWGSPQDGKLNGTLVRLPDGFSGTIRSKGPNFRAVVIQGRPEHGDAAGKTLEPGSYFGSGEAATHRVSCTSGEDCVIYVRATGTYDIVPAGSKK